ncbi:MAG: ATP-binding protein [Planctomycetota bacterium]
MSSPKKPLVAPENLRWFVVLRWLAFGALLGLVIYGHYQIDPSYPLATLLAFVGLGGVSNIIPTFVALKRLPTRQPLVLGLQLLDIGILTALLHLTGGAMNPFSVMYIVNIAMAGAMLSTSGLWITMMAAVTGFGSLFVLDALAPKPAVPHHELNGHLHGMWVAFTLAAGLITYFFQETRKALAAREAELDKARAREARNEKLSALGTLAAGTAHELSTPLATIHLAASELELTDKDVIREDASLIRLQAERCKGILEKMKAGDEELLFEKPRELSLSDLLEELKFTVEPDSRLVLDGFSTRVVRVRLNALGRAVRELLNNALLASPANGAVKLELELEAGMLRIAVSDSGNGIALEALKHVGEPFFTTRGVRGTGLGVFLATALIERLGGELNLYSEPGLGTRAELSLPDREVSR